MSCNLRYMYAYALYLYRHVFHVRAGVNRESGSSSLKHVVVGLVVEMKPDVGCFSDEVAMSCMWRVTRNTRYESCILCRVARCVLAECVLCRVSHVFHYCAT